jgi:gliding motility-associated protein GldM
MIGMMYLFLTAMLALNVSGEMLNAFLLVDRSILQSKETVELKNEELYYSFNAAYQLNRTRVGDNYQSALAVKTAADTLVNYIQNLKIQLVHLADGPEATLDSYKGISNTTAVGQFFLSDPAGLRRSATLKDSINNYRNFLVGIVEEDTAMVTRLEKTLSTNPPPPKEGVQKSWEEEKFNYVPMAATMALLSQIQADVRNMEADVVRKLFLGVDESSFRFNQITPLVIHSSNYVMQGDEYIAEIMMAAYDDTAPPEVIVGGQRLETRDGKGILRIPASRLGENTWSGTISILGPTGHTEPVSVGGRFLVAQPNVVISPSKMNVFYEGVENPVEISAPGVPSENLRPSITNGSIVRRGSGWIVNPSPGSAGREAIITVSAEVNNRSQVLGRRPFRVNRVPDPVAKVNNQREGTIARQVLLAQMGVVAEMENFDFDMSFRVTQFRVSTIRGGYTVDAGSENNLFTEEQKDLIRGTTRGQRVYIENIRAVGPDGRPRSLGTITLTID